MCWRSDTGPPRVIVVGSEGTDLIYNETGPSYDAGTTNQEASRGLALRAASSCHTHTRVTAIQRHHKSVPRPSITYSHVYKYMYVRCYMWLLSMLFLRSFFFGFRIFELNSFSRVSHWLNRKRCLLYLDIRFEFRIIVMIWESNMMEYTEDLK